MIEVIAQDSQPRGELWIQIVDNLSCYYDKEVRNSVSSTFAVGKYGKFTTKKMYKVRL